MLSAVTDVAPNSVRYRLLHWLFYMCPIAPPAVVAILSAIYLNMHRSNTKIDFRGGLWAGTIFMFLSPVWSLYCQNVAKYLKLEVAELEGRQREGCVITTIDLVFSISFASILSAQRKQGMPRSLKECDVLIKAGALPKDDLCERPIVLWWTEFALCIIFFLRALLMSYFVSNDKPFRRLKEEQQWGNQDNQVDA
ncbi:hypothetical protein BDZ91DRAFT_747178 [Kalaharituber pfeilii]|nr:hypothetical protein BDZ91DRAFT_747178 [Kalaharituber pfeilii]